MCLLAVCVWGGAGDWGAEVVTKGRSISLETQSWALYCYGK